MLGLKAQSLPSGIPARFPWNQTMLGLKENPKNPWGEGLELEIRPCWDWKQAFRTHQYNYKVLKSDHVGIERSPHQFFTHVRINLEIRPCWDWKVEGMLCENITGSLKSDHVGIERLEGEGPHCKPKFLKSDHVGIESGKSERRFHCSRYLEIRPCWDWKKIRRQLQDQYHSLEIRPCWDWKGYCAASIRSCSTALKSDHVGIERIKWFIKILSGETWNQTMLGLKVEITLVRASLTLPWNQTMLGLKGVCRESNESCRCTWNQTMLGLKENPNLLERFD